MLSYHIQSNSFNVLTINSSNCQALDFDFAYDDNRLFVVEMCFLENGSENNEGSTLKAMRIKVTWTSVSNGIISKICTWLPTDGEQA